MRLGRKEPRLTAQRALLPPRGPRAEGGGDPIAAAEILDAREAARTEVARSIEARFPDLLRDLRAIVEGASAAQLFGTSRALRREIGRTIDEWCAAQHEGLSRQAAETMLDADAEDPDLQLRWSEMMGIGATVVASVAPVAAFPFIASAAATVTTTFLIFPTAGVSMPFIAAGTAGIGGALLLSNGVRRYADNRIRKSWLKRLEKAAHRRVYARERSLQSTLFAEIDLVTQARLQEVS